MKIYLAAGWFSKEQENARLEALEAINDSEIEVYSPKDDALFEEGKTLDAYAVFSENLKQIRSSNLVVASTVGKDMGTLFECGYAYNCDIPIVYYFPNLSGFPLNLMLSQSACAVFHETEPLKTYLYLTRVTGSIVSVPYKGEQE